MLGLDINPHLNFLSLEVEAISVFLNQGCGLRLDNYE